MEQIYIFMWLGSISLLEDAGSNNESCSSIKIITPDIQALAHKKKKTQKGSMETIYASSFPSKPILLKTAYFRPRKFCLFIVFNKKSSACANNFLIVNRMQTA